MSLDNDAIRLIDKLYKDLYLDEQVLHHGTGNKYDKFNNIKEYLSKLEKLHNQISETGKHIDYLKKCYYDKYVINAEDIPESYYKRQEEMMLERGFGYVQVSKEGKIQLQQEIIENQEGSLDMWLDYFLSDDAKVYPFWAKYWAFQGMLKIGKYDKEKNIFYKRTKETVAPFCDLNREALSLSIDFVIRGLSKEKIEDTELNALVKTGSFQKIYTYVLTKVLSDNKNIVKRNIGKWVKYDQGSNHMPLVESLRGYNTGWCTAGENTAKNQLEAGDFYVYYTLDENNEYKVPRVAIRMEENKIAEIRGVLNKQNIEPEMKQVVDEKIKDFPDKDLYYKKVADMEQMTIIYEKHKSNEELTKEELTFLYEIYGKIKSFNVLKDPRIKEIKDKRNRRREDLARIFDCDESQIVFDDGEKFLANLNKIKKTTLDEMYKYFTEYQNTESNLDKITKDTVFYDGDLDLGYLTSTENLVLPRHMGGNLRLGDFGKLIVVDGLVLPKSIGGNLVLNGLVTAEGVVLPEYVGGNLEIAYLINAQGLVLPKYIGTSLFLNRLTSAEGLVLPKYIGDSLVLQNITSPEGLILPQIICGSLFLHSLTSAEGLVLPKSIGLWLYLNSLTSAEGLVLPQAVGKGVYLKGLTNADGLIIPEPLTYTIHMNGFKITPENVDQYRSNKSK